MKDKIQIKLSEEGERAGASKPYVVQGDENFRHITDVGKRKMLVAYSQTGSIAKACEAAEVARRTHHHWHLHDEEYAEAFGIAQEIAADTLEDEARRRAVEGVQEPVFYQGKIVGHKHIYSDTLLLAMLKKHKGYKENIQQENINHHDTQRMEDLRNLSPEDLAKLEEILGGSHENTGD